MSSQTLTEFKQKTTDSLAMLSKENKYINEMRRDYVLPQLGKDIKQIRFYIPKVSKTLFGENVSKIISSVKKMQKDIRTSSSYSSAPHYYKSKKSSYTPYNSRPETPYNSKKWRASHQNKAAPMGRRTGANKARTKG